MPRVYGGDEQRMSDAGSLFVMCTESGRRRCAETLSDGDGQRGSTTFWSATPNVRGNSVLDCEVASDLCVRRTRDKFLSTVSCSELGDDALVLSGGRHCDVRPVMC